MACRKWPGGRFAVFLLDDLDAAVLARRRRSARAAPLHQADNPQLRPITATANDLALHEVSLPGRA
jgi:hypothetical protein